jgi:hypothetical protein
MRRGKAGSGWPGRECELEASPVTRMDDRTADWRICKRLFEVSTLQQRMKLRLRRVKEYTMTTFYPLCEAGSTQPAGAQDIVLESGEIDIG